MRVTSMLKGTEHHVTISAHQELKIATLAEILGEVARYLEMERNELAENLLAR
jgi:predicted HTH domain antitoxin